MPVLEGFAPLPLDEAAALLARESELEGPHAEIAALLDCEPPVLRWAASLARATGWGPLKTRLIDWSVARAPWLEDVARVVDNLEDVALLRVLAACDAPFAWDVLETVVPDVSIEAILRLESAQVLRRSTKNGVVTFAVAFAVRAYERSKKSATDDVSPAAERWLDAWIARAQVLRSSSYGPNARATLAELAAAIPLAARALWSTPNKGLALWLAASDAIFFGDAIAYDAPAFDRALEVASAPDDRAQACVIAARAALERGAPDVAAQFAGFALEGSRRSEALRGAGWAAVALSRLDDARRYFEDARSLAEGEPRGQADATAGLGILALLGGDPAVARTRLDEALAIHVVMRDAPREAAVRGMMALLPESGPATEGSAPLFDPATIEELRAKGQRWREALVLARLALDARAKGDAVEERSRLAEARAAAMLSKMPAAELVRAFVEPAAAKAIVVGPEGRTLTLPDGTTHDLARHGPVRRVLWALTEARKNKPGATLSTSDLIGAGWPGEKMQHEAGTLRVYTTVRRLRGLGLGTALATRDDGYLLDPDVRVTTE